MKNSQFKRGFTLLELVLYVGIVSIVLTSLVTYAWNVVGIGEKSATQQEIYSLARYLSERIKYEIRSANDINFGSSNFGINLAQTPGAKLSLAKSAPNDPTEIDVAGGLVRIRRGSAVPTPVPLNSADTNVTDLTFTNYTSSDNKTKHVGFTLVVQSRYTGGRFEFKESAITIESSGELRSN